MLKKIKPYPFILSAFALLCLFPLAAPSSFNINEEISPILTQFPHQIGKWSGIEYQVDERTVEILETRNVLSRLYENGEGASIHLLIVASNKDRRVAHPPEVCYVSSNFEIIHEGQETFPSEIGDIPTKEFQARNERDHSDVQQVIYLYKIGDRLTTNYYSQQLQFAWDNLTRKESEIYLIRLAGPNKAALQDFLPKVLQNLTA